VSTIKVGYLGLKTERGPDTTTFGYMAAEKHFSIQRDSDEVAFINYPAHEEICYAVARQELDQGVVAVENSVIGFVPETIRAVCDAEMYGGLRVCAEVVIPIKLYYLRKEIREDPPKVVLSHSAGLTQCSRFIRSLRIQGIDTDLRRSTGEAAYEANQNPEYAVLASSRAENAYGLVRIEQRSVTDHKTAQTRFWVLGKQHAQKTGKDKSAFLVSLSKDEAGALWKMLGCFFGTETEDAVYRQKEKSSNLLYVYPLPIPGRPWEYNFLLEFSGHVNDPEIHEGLDSFMMSGLSLMHARFLGSYPSETI